MKHSVILIKHSKAMKAKKQFESQVLVQLLKEVRKKT